RATATHRCACATVGQRAKGRERSARSDGRATHAARIAEEVHMDPPPQAHTGVGHGPEYTTKPPDRSTHGHHVDHTVTAHGACAPARRTPRPPVSPARPPLPPPLPLAPPPPRPQVRRAQPPSPRTDPPGGHRSAR